MYMTAGQKSADSWRSQSRPQESSETQQADSSSGDRTICSPLHAATLQSTADSTHAFSQAVAATNGKARVANKHQTFMICCTGQQHPTALYVWCACYALTSENEGLLKWARSCMMTYSIVILSGLVIMQALLWQMVNSSFNC